MTVKKIAQCLKSMTLFSIWTLKLRNMTLIVYVFQSKKDNREKNNKKFVFSLQVNQIRYCLDTLLLTNLGDQSSYDLKTSNKKELLHSVKTCIVKYD